MISPRHWTLRGQLVSLVMVALLSLSAFLLVFLPSSMASSAARSQANGVVISLRVAVDAGVEFGDARSLAVQFEDLLEPLEMDYARVYSEDGTLLVATDEAAPPTLDLAAIDGIEMEERADVLHVSNRFETKNGVQAALVLGFSNASFERDVTQNRQWVLVICIVLVLLGAAGSLLMGTVLSRPIQEMSTIAGLIADGRVGEAERQLSAAGKDIDHRARLSEVDQLVVSFGAMVTSLRDTVRTLSASSGALGQAREKLIGLATAQSETITKQAASLQETQVTVREIKQTSEVATQKANTVLAATEEADEIGKTASAAIDQSLGGLADIRRQVDEIAAKINELSERTDQIGGITQTVKDLADQSNMLALNATIEAVRSGEHGKAFAVVAREIRSLADQSVQATGQVRDILEDVSDATNDAVQITDAGTSRIESSLGQLGESGDNLRKLSGIVRGNSAAARQIAAAVSQQNAGVTQIVAALSSLSQMMDDTVTRVEETKSAALTLSEISQDVTAIATQYEL